MSEAFQPKINAFALPSKDIFVYSGLVDLVDDDTLLSAVLAHEIAHVTQRHAVENVSRSFFGNLQIAATARTWNTLSIVVIKKRQGFWLTSLLLFSHSLE
jgi:predicted Zn-dependent protease